MNKNDNADNMKWQEATEHSNREVITMNEVEKNTATMYTTTVDEQQGQWSQQDQQICIM